MAPSDQCTSSITSIVGRRGSASSSCSAPKTASGSAALSNASASPPGDAYAASRSGPSTRGVSRSSQAPSRTLRSPVERGQERPDQAGLADACLAGDHHRRPMPVRRPVDGRPGAPGVPSAVPAAASQPPSWHPRTGTGTVSARRPPPSAGRRPDRCALDRPGRASATGRPAAASAAPHHRAGPIPARNPAEEVTAPCRAKTDASTAIPTTTPSSRTVVATPEACPCSVGATAPRTVAATGAKNNAEPAPIAAIPGTRAT